MFPVILKLVIEDDAKLRSSREFKNVLNVEPKRI